MIRFIILTQTISLVFFDKEDEKAHKDLILQLLSIVKNRINTLNKGRFIIEDYCTEYYENL